MLGRVLIGYAVAVIAVTATFIVSTLRISLSYDLKHLPMAIFGVGFLSALPFAICAFLAEIRGIRHWLYYTAFAGISGSVPWLVTMILLSSSDIAQTAMGSVVQLMRFGGCAAFGGYVYWIVAGRRAGLK